MGFIMKILATGVAAKITKTIVDAHKESKEREEAEQRRKNTVVCFGDALSFEDFSNIADRAVKQIRRKKITISVSGGVVFGRVESQSGLSTWDFKIDFNDYGEITGRYWLSSSNDDSIIPKKIADVMRDEIITRISHTEEI